MMYRSPMEIFMRASLAGAFIIPAFFLALIVKLPREEEAEKEVQQPKAPPKKVAEHKVAAKKVAAKKRKKS